MSVITEAEALYANAKDELGKFEAALPTVLAKVKQLEGNPLADLAVKAGEALANQVLPAEAVAAIARTASKVYDEIAALYIPAQPVATTPPVAA